MEARQKIVFTGPQERLPSVPSDLKKYGSLPYNFKGELPPLPIPLLKSKNREKEIEDGLQYLAGHPSEKFPADGTIRFLQLVQLLRTANETDYFDLFFKRYSSQPAYRRVILDLIPAVGNPVAIKFLRHKMEHGELTSFEISQTLLVFFHFCNASEEVVEEAMIIVTEVLSGPNSVYRTAITLGYGSLLKRYCSALNVCPDKYLKPLTDFGTKVTQSSDTEGIILVLKSYGNVGHHTVLKPIMKFMPNSASSSDFRIPGNAILALRNLGKRDPARVQGITLQIILNHKLDPTARVLAAMVLYETKPSLPVLMILANAMLNETSKQVENFVYTLLSGMASFTAPDLRELISASRLALKVLSRKIQQPAGYRFSRVYFGGIFKEPLMAGVAAKFLFLYQNEKMLPTLMITKFRTNFLGHIFAPLEVGFGFPGMPNVLERAYASGRDLKDLLSSFSDQKTSHETIIGGYLRMFDQEILTGDLKSDIVQEMLQDRTTFPSVKELLDILKNHNTLQWDKNFMSAEIHRVVPTCTGLPWQISLVHISNTKLVGNAQLSITPEPTSHFTLADMINSNIKLKTKLSLSIFKDMFLTMGVITPELQAVLEENAKLTVNVPVNVDVTMNIKEKNFKVELPPCKQEIDIISLRFKTSAVTRNIEEAPASKSTPLLLPETMSKIMKQSFDFSSAEQDRRKDASSSDIRSAEKIYSQKQSEHHLDSVRQTMCFEACTFGCKACLESSNAYAGCILGDSLYNIVGEHVFKLTLEPHDTRSPIEKLLFTIQGGAHAVAEKVQLLRNEERELRIKRMEERTISSEEFDFSSESSSSSDSWPKDSEKVMNLKHVPVDNEEEQQEHGQMHYRNQEKPPEKRKKPLSAERSTRNRNSSQQKQGRSNDSSSSDSSPESISSDSRRSNSEINKRRQSDENKFSMRPLTKYDDEEQDRQSWDDLSPPWVRGLQWSVFSFKESHPNQEESSSSSSSSESVSRNSRDTKSQSSDSSLPQETENHGDELLPYFTVMAQALRSDSKDQGYKFSMYMKHEMYKTHMKMVATELAKTKWRACFDSHILPYRFQNRMSWGKECRDYRIEMKASRGQVARHAALQMNMKWTKLPSFLREQASRAMEFLPGFAYASGFTAVYQKNPSRELMLRMIATSPYTTAIIFKIPGETFYKDALCSPFILPFLPAELFEPSQITSFNILNLASWLAQGAQAVCEVGEEKIVTFDDKIFNITLRKQDCDLLVVQDCNKNANYQPKFHLWTRKPNPKLPREIHLNLTTVYIKILPSLDAITVLYNDKPVLVDNLLYEDPAAKIKLFRNDTTVAIEAPQYGLVNVTYDHILLRVTVASTMKGNTCGLCGDNNGEKRNEGLMPNGELALSDIDFLHSWSSTDNCFTEMTPTISEPEKAVAS